MRTTGEGGTIRDSLKHNGVVVADGLAVSVWLVVEEDDLVAVKLIELVVVYDGVMLLETVLEVDAERESVLVVDAEPEKGNQRNK